MPQTHPNTLQNRSVSRFYNLGEDHDAELFAGLVLDKDGIAEREGGGCETEGGVPDRGGGA